MKSLENNPHVRAVSENLKQASGISSSADAAMIGQLLAGVINGLLAVAHEVEKLRTDVKDDETHGA